MSLGEGQAKALDRVHEPLYDFGFKTIVGRSYDGDVRIPADGDLIWP